MKIINGCKIEGIVPHGLGDFRIGNKRVIEGRYWNINGVALCIVAVVTFINGEEFDWAAYIGGTPDSCSEEETIEFVWQYGAKLTKGDALHFFPGFKHIYYRE